MTDEANANIIDVSDATFEFDVIQRSHKTAVVVDFWAPWCGPCRALGPILEALAGDPSYDFVLAKLNVDENPSVAMRYQVQGIPAVKAFIDGQVADEFVGALPEGRVRAFLEKLIPNEADIAYREAASLLATRHWAEAEAALREMLLDHPQHEAATMGLARALLAQAKGCEAKDLLSQSIKGPEIVQAERLLPLARYLCRMEVEDEDLDVEPIEMQYRQAARLLKRHNLEASFDGLLDVIREDKRYRKGEPKEVMLALFELIGEGDPLTESYRRELATVMF
jgi:putative thioredoxin